MSGISVWAGAHHHKNAFTQNESNAFALWRSLWNKIGGYREGFARSGGGLCNLEIFSRLVERPHARNILLLGETTFHQVHGGAATSDVSYFAASLEEFKEVTGHDYRLPCYNFEVDVGANFGRQKLIDAWYSK